MAHYMELWDPYDEKLNKIDGMTLVRGEEVPDGVFHLVCDIITKMLKTWSDDNNESNFGKRTWWAGKNRRQAPSC